MKPKDLILTLYQDTRTVFELNEVSMLLNEPNYLNLKRKLNYHVHSGALMNPRRGIYTKKNFSVEELVCKVIKPSYLSMEYVLQKNGLIFQYGEQFTLVSYMSREIDIEGNKLKFRKLKNSILLSTQGIERSVEGRNIATPERAFLDILYLNKNYCIDYSASLDKEKIKNLLPIYSSKTLIQTVKKYF